MRSLSQVQFSETPNLPRQSTSYTVHRQTSGADIAIGEHSRVLGHQSGVNSSSGAASAWLPHKVLPYGKATAGQLFKPFG